MAYPYEEFESETDAKVRRAVERERERCARMVESWLGATTDTKHLVAPLVKIIREQS